MNSDNLMRWKTVRLSRPIANGDVVGCGWLRGEEGNKGSAYFTLNGEKFDTVFTDVPGELLPFVFIQKKVSLIVIVYYDHSIVYYSLL